MRFIAAHCYHGYGRIKILVLLSSIIQNESKSVVKREQVMNMMSLVKRLSRFLFRSPDEIGNENYLILVLCILVASLGIIGTAINIMLGLGIILILATAVPSIGYILLYLYCRKKQNYAISRYLIVFLSLGALDIQWFINYGSYGPILYLFVILETFIILFFDEKQRKIMLYILFLNVTAIFLFEYYNPSIIGQYQSRSVRLMDLYSAILLYLLINIALLNLGLWFYKRQKEKAQESDKLKSAFLANMSHEIRTPMNGILGFAELLKEPGLSAEKQRYYISIIEKSGARMLNLINDLLNISRIESGLMEVVYRDVAINSIMKDTYSFFKPEADAKHIGLHPITPPGEEPVLTTDQDKVSAVLINLVKNAIKYTDSGFVEFGYHLLPKSIEFFVRDSGVGIPLHRQQAIFERFIQADISDRMARQGAGLGLSISKAYVELLGGRIWVESKPGEGALFRFTIPYKQKPQELQQEQKRTSAGLTEQQRVSSKKWTLLIVEDDSESRLLVEAMLKHHTREILRAVNGKEAVDLCRSRPDIDLILMDIKMPVMDGYEATRQIRAFNPKVVIVAQTAYGLRGDQEKALEAGCNAYLSKPISISTVISVLSDY
jgi:signal transduction histidine kinase/AmiR/NasT family two-component response regulator